MDANGRNTKEELLESIEELYGFKKELIYDPEQCALWAVRFTVNSIRYLGNIPFHGAKPMLAVEGYTAKHYDHETPVEDWDWDKCLRNQNIRIYRITDRMSGRLERSRSTVQHPGRSEAADSGNGASGRLWVRLCGSMNERNKETGCVHIRPLFCWLLIADY